jgi:hypothetical protein
MYLTGEKMDARFDKTEAICLAVALTECKLGNTGSIPCKGTFPCLLHYIRTGSFFPRRAIMGLSWLAGSNIDCLECNYRRYELIT